MIIKMLQPRCNSLVFPTGIRKIVSTPSGLKEKISFKNPVGFLCWNVMKSCDVKLILDSFYINETVTNKHIVNFYLTFYSF